MKAGSRRVALNMGRSLRSGYRAGLVVAIIFIVPFASQAARTHGQQYSVIAGVDAKNAILSSRDIIVRVDNFTAPATAINASPEIPRNVAIVLETEPDQAKVLSKEKDLAIALINEMADSGTSFTIASAGISPKIHTATPDRSVATELVRGTTGNLAPNANVTIYDAIGSAIRAISFSPGIRVVIFIGEGNDGGSRLRYSELRSLAESNQIAFYAALVADHSLRGTKAILRYGWNLRELASDAAGIFLENPETPKATRRLSENVRSLRLIAFEIPSLRSGRHNISISARGKKLRAQKVFVIP